MPAPSFSWSTWLRDTFSDERVSAFLWVLSLLAFCAAIVAWGVGLLEYRDNRDLQRRESALSRIIARALLLCSFLASIGFVGRVGRLWLSLTLLCGLILSAHWLYMSYGETLFRMEIRLAAHVFRPRESSEWMRKLVRWVFGLFALMCAFELYLLTTWGRS